MDKLLRRDMLKLGAFSTAVLAGLGLTTGSSDRKGVLQGDIRLLTAGKDFSPITMKERKAIPSSCWQCVTRDGIIGYVEDGRLVKIEGNPELPRTNGKICARGHAGINIVYNPDRLLYPLKRVGSRREGNGKGFPGMRL